MIKGVEILFEAKNCRYRQTYDNCNGDLTSFVEDMKDRSLSDKIIVESYLQFKAEDEKRVRLESYRGKVVERPVIRRHRRRIESTRYSRSNRRRRIGR